MVYLWLRRVGLFWYDTANQVIKLKVFPLNFIKTFTAAHPYVRLPNHNLILHKSMPYVLLQTTKALLGFQKKNNIVVILNNNVAILKTTVLILTRLFYFKNHSSTVVILYNIVLILNKTELFQNSLKHETIYQ